eukprot:CAMPEP_0176488854 /NCGR_PEP_ID=MMETSP0200_2-20121128/6950_1 /TAXON_ID=947934 /ORGANISM="Chaetoceros sp., Strain GSL56" /LENGTH=701 /DNA_ID=CAMNT_0017885903 /DNA_START=32 /DNA_END=2137 /DNA_ORIENTATION=+
MNEISSDESTSSTEEMAKGPLNTPSTPPAAPNSFESINPPLSQGVLAAISRYGFKTMTPVQKATIPLFLTNKDVCVQAVTGSGKTLAFLIPMVEIILRRTVLLTQTQIGGLVISPTRELARQTYDIAKDLCRFASLTEPLLLVGGGGGHRPVTADLDAFSKAGSDIVIGTPGRIDDILSRYNDVQVNELECLVLDEADVLLDMGFEVTLTSILSKLPKMRRTGLFSATKSGTIASGASAKSVKKLMARAGLRNPVMINVAIAAAAAAGPEDKSASKNVTTVSADQGMEIAPQEQATPSSLTNYYVISPLDEKLSRLVAFLKQHKDEKIIVFFLTCACVEYYGLALKQLLRSDTYYIETLHGKLAPKRREKAMERFRSGDASGDDSGKTSVRKAKGSILLCTDVAARGLDVPDIEWTVQFDAPVDPSQYIHRVGRSARAGRLGSSLIFLTPKEDSFIDFLRNRKVPIIEIGNDERCAPSMSVVTDNITKDKQEENKETIQNVLPKIRQFVLEDRDLLEKGTKAYTSYIRAYKEHQCAFIFRFSSLDLGLLATSFSLLRLPKMPELRDKLDKINFQPAGPEIDIHAVQYKDKVREKARQKRLAAELAAGGKNAKQIKAEQRLAKKLQKEKERRQEAIVKGRNPDKKRGRQAQMFDEWDELAKEERLHKKLKQGKITKEKYRELMYGDKKGCDSDDVMTDSDVE